MERENSAKPIAELRMSDVAYQRLVLRPQSPHGEHETTINMGLFDRSEIEQVLNARLGKSD